MLSGSAADAQWAKILALNQKLHSEKSLAFVSNFRPKFPFFITFLPEIKTKQWGVYSALKVGSAADTAAAARAGHRSTLPLAAERDSLISILDLLMQWKFSLIKWIVGSKEMDPSKLSSLVTHRTWVMMMIISQDSALYASFDLKSNYIS